MKKILVLVVFFSLNFSFSVLAQLVVTGADDISVEIKNADKIITIGGSITETVYALGFGDNVIATDQSSTHPPQVFSLPRVPYLRTLTSEGILSLAPTLILSSDDANPKSAIKQIRDAGTSLLLVKEIESLDGVTSKISTIGKALGANEKARELIDLNTRQYQTADSLRTTLTSEPKVLFILAVRGESTFMVAGSNTSAQKMIELAGGKNAFYNFEGYKTATNEAILAADSDYILIMETRREEIEFGLRKTPGINLTSAVKNNHILAMDGNYLLGFGPRFGAAILDLMKLLHPDLAIDL